MVSYRVGTIGVWGKIAPQCASRKQSATLAKPVQRAEGNSNGSARHRRAKLPRLKASATQLGCRRSIRSAPEGLAALMDPSSNGKQELRESAVSDKEGRFHVALHELLPMVRSVALPCSPSSSARNGLGLIRGSRRAWCML